MLEVLLNGIINIFAILTFSLDKNSRSGASEVVDSYLQEYLGVGTAGDIYLGLYNDLIDFYDGWTEDDLRKIAVGILAGLHRELPRFEQYICLMRFFELSARVPGGNRAVASYIDLWAEQFAIDREAMVDLNRFFSYVNTPYPLPAGFLKISGGSPNEASGAARLTAVDFEGEALVHHVGEIDGFFMMTLSDHPLHLDGNRLVPGRAYWLPPGSIIQDGAWRSVYYSEIYSSFHRVKTNLVFEGRALNFRFPGSHTGLHDFSFSVSSGNLVAIMGGSGAGKSTLLNILNGNLRPDEGRLTINGHDPYQNPEMIDGMIGFVPQDDLLFEDLTVFENLYYCAKLCFGDLEDRDIATRVEDVLKELGQIEIRDLKVGSPLEKTISGGQRKRLNIALELIRAPSLIFVDEPTSGLSSSDSENVMSLLKAQALKGKLVFVVIHQPSSAIFKSVDRLWILDQGGRPVYDGHPLEAITYFRAAVGQAGSEEFACPGCGNVNPDQIFAILESKVLDDSGRYTSRRRIPPEEWHRRFLEKFKPLFADQTKCGPLPEKTADRPGAWDQFKIFLTRNIKARLANRNYLVVNILEPPALALFIGLLSRGLDGRDYVFRENVNVTTFFFMCVIVSLFLGLSVSAEEICGDRRILLREKFLNLSRFAYLSSKTAYLAAVMMIQTAVVAVIANSVIEIPDMFVASLAVLFSCALVSSLIGLNVSAAFSRAVTIYILIPLLLIPQMLLCGVVIDFGKLIDHQSDNRSVPWYAEIMPARWGLEALLVRQYTENAYMKHFIDQDNRRLQASFMADSLIADAAALADYPFLPDKPLDFEQTAGRNLALLCREIPRIEKASGLHSGLEDSRFTLEHFTRDDWRRVRDFLKSARKALYREIRAAKGEIRDQEARLEKALTREGLMAMKNRHTNVSVEDMAIKAGMREKITQGRTRLVQLAYPIAHTSTSVWGRSHFMARHKAPAGGAVDTFWFNIAVLGLMSILLFLTLYCNVLPRLADGAAASLRLLRRHRSMPVHRRFQGMRDGSNNNNKGVTPIVEVIE